MTLRLLGRMFVVTLLLATAPAIAFAQEAVLSGTVTDLTGAVLPGVAITAVHQATGNKFSAVTDERGVYRIAARATLHQRNAVVCRPCALAFRPDWAIAANWSGRV